MPARRWLLRLKEHGLLPVILLAALALRLYHLDRYSFWYDESVTVLDRWKLPVFFNPARFFEPEFLLKHFDYLKILYNRGIVANWGSFFGLSEFSLRLSSVLAALAGIYILYKVANRFFGRRTGLAAALFAAVSPLHVYYSQELRPYALTAALGTAALYFFYRALETRRARYWACYAVTQAAHVYLIYTGLLLFIPFFLYFIINLPRLRDSLKEFILTHLAIIASLLPVFLTLYPNFRFVLASSPESAFTEFPTWADYRISPAHLFYTLRNFGIGYNVDTLWLAKAGVIIASFLFLNGVWKYRKDKAMQLILCYIFSPMLVLFLLSQYKTCYVERYFFPALPLYLAVIAAGSSFGPGKGRGFAAASLLMLFTGVAGLAYYYAGRLPVDGSQAIGAVGIGQRQDIRPLVKQIISGYRPGDRILHISKNTVFPLKLYLRTGKASDELIREADRGTVIFLSDINGRSAIFTLNYEKLHPDTFLRSDYNLAYTHSESAGRIWLIFSDFVFPKKDSPKFAILDALKAEGLNEVKAGEFEGASLYLFSREKP